MSNFENEKNLVFGDLHGRVDKAIAIFREYGYKVDNFISTGDVIDGYDSKSTIDLIKQMGVILVRGNHEQTLLLAMCHENEELRHNYSLMWSRCHEGTLDSYSVYPIITSPLSAIKLKNKMDDLGHLDYLKNSKPFVEKANFAVLHGSVNDKPWYKQKNQLNEYFDNCFIKDEIEEIPYQLGYDVKFPNENNLALSGINKILISGHFHSASRNIDFRSRSGGRQVFLATHPKDNFIPVYESWSQEVKIIELN